MSDWPDVAARSAEADFLLGIAERVTVPDDKLATEAAELSGSLVAFQKAAWTVVEPRTPYIHNWHIDAICEHLEAVGNGEIRQLVINIPPRHEKSLNCAVFWPAWEWTRRPATRWLFSSYSQPLSTRDSVKCRRIIQSPWYQARWGSGFRLTSDQNVKNRFENNRTGVRLATSVGGAATGEGGDFVIVDDPHNVKEAESTLKRQGVLQWWDEVMSTRVNDPEKSGKVIVMQRVHDRDLTGHVLEQGGYEHLVLPAEYDPTVQVYTSLDWQDPRTKEGELLWPDRFSREAVEDLKVRLGPYAAAGQLQQRPAPRKGGLFDRSDFRGPVVQEPRGGRYLRYWDKAGTMEGGAYSIGLLMCWLESEDRAYIVDVVRGQWDAGARERVISQTSSVDALRLGGPLGFEIVVEQEPGSGGKESAENTIKRLTGYRVRADRPTGDKFTRADPLAGAAKNGQVWLVEGPWNEAFLREMESAGPGATYLDQMDAAAGAFNRLHGDRIRVAPKVRPAGSQRPSYWKAG